MISIKQLKKHFGALKVLDGIDLEITPGEVVSVLGPSGSGKSTMIRCINGLEPITAGSITVDGHDVSSAEGLKQARKVSATVFQLFNLYPHMTVLRNITLAPINVLKMPDAEANEKAMELLRLVGLAELADAYPQRLSGGQRQRVGICRALAMEPRYLLLDEITSALDPEMTSEVLGILAELAKTGTTMIFVTHEIEFARRISDRIVFLEGGELVVDLPTDAFFAAATDGTQPRVERFLSKMEGDKA